MAPRAYVVGAGIAGLAAACGLERLGYDVVVLEREDGLRTQGAGLTLWPNALRALDALRLGEAARSCAHTLHAAVTRTPAGTELARVPLTQIEERFGPLVSVRRPELLAVLGERFGGEVRFGCQVTAAGGSLHAGDQPLTDALVVGADGIGSVVRSQVAPEVEPRPAGYGAWRGVAPIPTPTPVTASESLGRGQRFGLVPLAGERTYWFAVLAGGGRDSDLRREFAGWHSPIGEILQATPSRERSYLEISELPPLPRWHRGQAVLVGDAAHAMTPNLGQGAAQALQDVAVLVRELGRRSPAAAMEAYVSERKRRAERVTTLSRTLGRVAQASGPLTTRARNAMTLLTPQAVTLRQFASVLGE